MKKLTHLIAILTAGTVVLTPFVGHSQEATAAAKEEKKSPAFAGLVTEVDTTARTVTVANKKKDETVTYTLTETTKFTDAEGKEAAMEVVTVGTRVRVNPTAEGETTAKAVKLVAKKDKEEKEEKAESTPAAAE